MPFEFKPLQHIIDKIRPREGKKNPIPTVDNIPVVEDDYHADMSEVVNGCDGRECVLPDDWHPGSPHSESPSASTKQKRFKPEEKIKNGATRMRSAIDKQIKANIKAGETVEPIMRYGFAFGVGLTTLGVFQVGLPLMAISLAGEGVNALKVKYSNHRLHKAEEAVKVCENTNNKIEDIREAASVLRYTSRYLRYFEGTSRTLSRISMVFLGNVHTIVDLAITALESKDDFALKVKQPVKLENCFEGARRELMKGVDQILKKKQDQKTLDP